MASSNQAQDLARNDGINTFANDQSSKYTPQFSAATQMILERIHSGNSASFSSMGISTATAPPGYEDMRRSVLQSMRTSMSLSTPSTPSEEKKTNTRSSRSAHGSGLSTTPTSTSTGSGKKGKNTNRKSRSKTSGKRKRIKNESENSDEESDENMSKLGGDSGMDDSDEVTKLPKVTQSGRHIVKPTQFAPAIFENSSRRRASSRKIPEQALCKRCGRGHSPQNNLIVFCDGCNLPWHQKCHDPIIADDAVQVESTLWFCADCSRKKGIKSRHESPKGISWAGKSMEEKRAYLSSQSHSQLVTLLLQATYLHPDIPLFPFPTLNQTTPFYLPRSQSYSASNSSTAGSLSRSENHPAVPMNFIRKRPSPTPYNAMSFMHVSSAPPMSSSKDSQLSRESTPASPPYPRPGNGLMAKLGPDDVDVDWLVDGNDYGAFSHIVHENDASHDAKLSAISAFGIGMGDVGITHSGVSINGMGVGV
ncbi:putative phd domain containing protein [Golovinomyces cichoracearum]|uniref:Putative phd domain containing protein n=1 Tax=Golovinomyces cichoracearum TaxID=62708 RepID=A0A420HQD2_9PEZI|nr:putative phd domain containing protein [Golovinomyces cichoracearum]